MYPYSIYLRVTIRGKVAVWTESSFGILLLPENFLTSVSGGVMFKPSHITLHPRP